MLLGAVDRRGALEVGRRVVILLCRVCRFNILKLRDGVGLELVLLMLKVELMGTRYRPRSIFAKKVNTTGVHRLLRFQPLYYHSSQP